MSEIYYHYREADSVLGRVGKGPLNTELPPFERIAAEVPCPVQNATEVHLPDMRQANPIQINCRIRPFSLFYKDMDNFIMFEEDLLPDFEAVVSNLQKVQFQFARGMRTYVTGRLIHRYAFSTITDFSGGSFDVYDCARFEINGTLICRGEQPAGEGFVKISEGITAESVDEFMQIDKQWALKLCKLHPSKLRLRGRDILPVFHFDTTTAFFHESIVEKLSGHKNSGAWFPGPPVPVEYVT